MSGRTDNLLKELLSGASESQLVLFDLSTKIQGIVGLLSELNDNEEYRTRALSLAITNIETGLLWLSAAAADLETRDQNRG